MTYSDIADLICNLKDFTREEKLEMLVDLHGKIIDSHPIALMGRNKYVPKRERQI